MCFVSFEFGMVTGLVWSEQLGFVFADYPAVDLGKTD